MLPARSEELAGVTVMDVNSAGVTLIVVDPPMALRDAKIVVMPTETPVASPELLMVATRVLKEVHVT